MKYNSLSKIPKDKIKYLTLENYVRLIERAPRELEFVPLPYKTKELCMTALKMSVESYKYIPLDLQRDREIIEFAINQSPLRDYNIIGDIPPDVVDDKIRLSCAKRALQYLAEDSDCHGRVPAEIIKFL